MERVKSNKRKSEQAKVKIDGPNVRISFIESEQVVTLKTKNQPDFIKSGKFSVRLNAEGDEIQDMRPWNGVFPAKFSHIVSRKDEPPAPRQMEGKYGPYLSFTVICKLLGEFEGMTVPIFFRYPFGADAEGNARLVGGGDSVDLLESFLEVTGVMDTDIKYDDNILPALNKKLRKLDRTFNIGLKDGNASGFFETTDSDPDDDDEDDDTGLVSETLDDDDDEPKNVKYSASDDEDDD